MTREEYEQILSGDPDEITLTDADILEWLDGVVDALNTVRHNSYELQYGKFKEADGEYEHAITPCMAATDEYKTYHIYGGIKRLAEIAGESLSVEYIENTGKYEHYFTYKGVRLFQLSESEDKGSLR